MLNRFAHCLSLTLLAIAIGSSPAWGQDSNGAPPSWRVPLLEPRAGAGPTPDTSWQTSRTEAEDAPVASFLKSVQGSDVQIEVILGQARLLTTKQPIATENGSAVIAVSDPSIVDFEVLPNPRMIRLIGKRPGVTDLSIITADDESYIFEVHVVFDLSLLNTQLRHSFPDTEIRVSQMRGFLVLQGQARNVAQVAAIESALRGYTASLLVSGGGVGNGRTPAAGFAPAGGRAAPPGAARGAEEAPDAAYPVAADDFQAQIEPGQRTGMSPVLVAPEIINLMRVPGVHQVLLQVKIGELNRTALREIGADWFFNWANGNVIGTHIGGAGQTLNGITELGTRSTAFGIFPSGSVAIVLRALRENSVLNVLAEPNLIAMSGQEANFLAGGQFPVPVPQGGGGVVGNNVTVQFKNFGVQLAFVPYVLDEETIRLHVAPEVSSIDPLVGTTLVVGGDRVPGLSTRRVETTVELKQGNTLALAGLLQVDMDARTQRIPGIGDLPYLGPLFSNTTHRRVEKELLVLVTPYLVHPMSPDQAPPLPGSEIEDPNNLEFYLLNRIEGRTGRNFRATTSWDDVWHLVELMRLEQCYIQGPIGFSE